MYTIKNQKLRGIAYLCAPIVLIIVSRLYSFSKHFLSEHGLYTIVEFFMHPLLGLLNYAAFFLCIPFGLYLIFRKSTPSASVQVPGGSFQEKDSAPSVLPWIKGCLIAFCIGFIFLAIILSTFLRGLH